MNEKKEICDLCGLPVEIDGFRLISKESIKKFCCEGCKGIYQLLYDKQIFSDSEKKG